MFMKYLRLKCLQLVASPHTNAIIMVRDAQVLVNFITGKGR